MNDPKKYLEELLTQTAQSGASDLHLSPSYYPTLRIDSRLIPLTNREILDAESLVELIAVLSGPERKDLFKAEKELDFSLTAGNSRFRVNIYQTNGGPAAALRLIPKEIKTLEELNLPPVLRVFTKLSQGFVLIVGPNGHGKSTTMASLIDTINHERGDKIVTIEDPIEYIFNPDKSIIDQREIPQDSLSFDNALRSTFRQNVNVIMIGEMRDFATMSTAVSAAETGHLVFASLHTNSASQTIQRIIDAFPSDQQAQIRSQLASTISGIVSQRLIPRIQGGLIPAVEVMVANTAVRTLIRDNNPQQLDMVIETGQEAGMISLDRSLSSLLNHKEITMEQAEFYSINPKNIRNYGI